MSLLDQIIENTDTKGTVTEIHRSDQGPLISVKRTRATLVMLSGGIDSTYALVKLLRETEDDVIVHHIHLVNREGRHHAEALACKAIVETCRSAFRDFIYTESTIDRSRFQSFGMDVITAAFEAAIVCESFRMGQSYGIDRWTTGACLEEIEASGREGEERRLKAMFACIEANCSPNPPPRYFQLPYQRKRDQIAYIGPDLARMCWTCRTPQRLKDESFAECGQCKTCKLIADCC